MDTPIDTPFCKLCHAQLEIGEAAVALMQGQFHTHQDGYAPMILEVNTNFVALTVDGKGDPYGTAQKMLVVDTQNLGELQVVHFACLMERFVIYAEDEDDEDDDGRDSDYYVSPPGLVQPQRTNRIK